MHKITALVLGSVTLLLILSPGFSQGNTALAKNNGTASRFIRSLVVWGKDCIKTVLASNFGKAIKVVFNILMGLYKFYNGARNDLGALQFEMNEFYMIMETEIAPMLKIIEKILEKGESGREMKKFCDGKHPLKEKLDKQIDDLRLSRKNIENRIQTSRSSGIVESVIANVFENDDKKAHDILYRLQSEAMDAEKSLRKARSDINQACII